MSNPSDWRRRCTGLACGLLLAFAPAAVARADLGDDLIEDGVANPGLMDVSRFDGTMPPDAETQFGIDLSQRKALDVSPELENGTDIGFGQDKRKPSGLGEANVLLGDVDEDEVDVRGGFYKATSKGQVIFGWQMGEPDKVSRGAGKVKVGQSRELAVFLAVIGGDPMAPVADVDMARVPGCKVKATFRDKKGTYSSENLPDFGAWVVKCKKGWSDVFPALTADGAKVLRKVLGGKSFKEKGKGPALDIDQALQDLDLPFL